MSLLTRRRASVGNLPNPSDRSVSGYQSWWVYAILTLGWLYCGAAAIWVVLRFGWGDRIWWMALLNSFVPYLFVPSPICLACALCLRRPVARALMSVPPLVFALLYGSLWLPRSQIANAKVPAGELTLMTFNMWGGSREAETARVVAEVGYPDIVAVQELTPEMIPVLLEEAGEVYPYRELLPGKTYRGMGMMSRYPMMPLDIGHLSDAACDVQAAVVSSPYGPVTVYNVHPGSSNLLLYAELGVPIGSAVRDSVEGREACVSAIITDLETRAMPVIVMGDLNATDQSDAYRLLRGSLRDAHRDVGRGFGHTFPAYGGSWHGAPILPRQMRIDMIFYSDELRAVACRVGEIYGESDHLPVVGRVGWRDFAGH